MTDGQDSKVAKAAMHLREALAAIDVPLESDPEMAETPDRVAKMFAQLFSGVHRDPPTDLAITAVTDANMVLLRDLPFYSMCAHHLLPFFGRAHIAYIPDGQVAGFGSFAKVLDHFALQPQLQERLAEEIADFIDEHLKPQGVIIHLVARQLCMEMRGASKQGWTEYTAARGVFLAGREREEFFQRISVPMTIPY